MFVFTTVYQLDFIRINTFVSHTMQKSQASILIVEDDASVLTSARLFLKQKFSYVHGIPHPDALEKVLDETPFDIVLLDMNYAHGEQDGKAGLRWIEYIVRHHPDTEVIPITAYGDIELAVETLKKGARDFITKPWQNEKLFATVNNLVQLKKVQHEAGLLRQQLNEGESEVMIGSSGSYQKMLETIQKVAPTDANVLILGENGSGKELVARALHRQSARRDHPFVKIDLGSLSENLFESELFGHVAGAFTDAKADREGKLQMANGGTLFLDEIGNIALSQQAKLLTVLQQRSVTKIGSNKSTPLDVRIIAATNADLGERLKAGTFRQDFLYRINTIELTVPPLRERGTDIQLLAQHYFGIYKQKYGKKALKLSQETLKALSEYSWPGNVRELNHLMERTVIMIDHPVIVPSDLPLIPLEPEGSSDLNIEDMEKSLILRALKKHKGNMTHAARDLGIDRQALYRRLEKYGL